MNEQNWLQRNWPIPLAVVLWIAACWFAWWIIDPSNASQRTEWLKVCAQAGAALFIAVGLIYTHRTVENARQATADQRESLRLQAEKQQETLEHQRETLRLQQESQDASLAHQRKSQQDERFFNASKLLFEDPGVSAHIGALYTLEQLAKESEDHYEQVIEVICAFVRDRSREDRPTFVERDQLIRRWEKAERELVEYNESIDPLHDHMGSLSEMMVFPTAAHDIDIAMRVLARRKHRFGKGEVERLDLRGVHLSGLSLEAGEFQWARFNGAVAINSTFTDCNLADTSFTEADLRFSTFDKSMLMDAVFRRADLRHAEFRYMWKVKDPSLRRIKPVEIGVSDVPEQSYDAEDVDASTYLEESHWAGALMDKVAFWCNDLSAMRGITKAQYSVMDVKVQHKPPKFTDRIRAIQVPPPAFSLDEGENDGDDS